MVTTLVTRSFKSRPKGDGRPVIRTRQSKWRIPRKLLMDEKLEIKKKMKIFGKFSFAVVPLMRRFVSKLFFICVFRSSILNDVSSSASRKLPSNKSLVLLGINVVFTNILSFCFLLTHWLCFQGNDGTGKTSLIVKMQNGIAEVKKGHAMEYSYIDVYDEDRDGKSSFINKLCLILDDSCLFVRLLASFRQYKAECVDYGRWCDVPEPAEVRDNKEISEGCHSNYYCWYVETLDDHGYFKFLDSCLKRAYTFVKFIPERFKRDGTSQ